METAGHKLKRVREKLKLTYREVEEASQQIAGRMGSPEFAIALSRLADIENKGTVPSLYRIFALCTIYKLDPNDVSAWYGAPFDQVPGEAMKVRHPATHAIRLEARGSAALPLLENPELDLRETAFLSRLITGWGRTPLRMLQGLDLRAYRYGWIGTGDGSMYPVLHPGSLVLIDPAVRIASGGWTSEYDRPIYFFEKRDGFLCGWCSVNGSSLTVLAHPASETEPRVYRYPQEIELLGQVVGAAMWLDGSRRRSVRHPAAQAGSPDRRSTTGAPHHAPRPASARDSEAVPQERPSPPGTPPDPTSVPPG